MKKGAVKKKVGRPPVEPGDPGPKYAKILSALTLYYSTGSYAAVRKGLRVPQATLHDWIKKYPKLCEDAKRLAMDYRLQRGIEAIDKIEYRILEILDSKEKINFNQLVVAWGIHRDKYDRQMGIADRRVITGEVNINHKIFERYILLKEQAKKELSVDSSSRLKNAD